MGAPVDGRLWSRRATLPFLVFAAITWSWAAWRGAARPEPDLYPFLKRAWPGASYERRAAGGFAAWRGGEALGHAAAASAMGYGGPITVAVATSPDGAVVAAALLEYRDTPDLLRTTRSLVAAFVGKRAGDRFQVGEDVDAVVGATYSSRGLAEAARQATALAAAAGETARAPRRWEVGAPEVALAGLFAAAAWGRHRRRLAPRRRAALRAATLGASLVALGFVWDRPWVIAFPLRLAAGEPPPAASHLYWYLLAAGVLFVCGRDGRGPWCPWLCPFGAAQDLVGRLGGAHRRRPAHGPAFVWIRRGLLWLAVFLGLLHRSPGAASYEVFGTLFRAQGSGYQWALLALALACALFVARPFCHWVCPVEPLERALAAARARLLGRPRRAVVRRGSPALPVVRAAGPAATVRRWRDRLVTALGLLAALLVVAHLATRFSRLSAGPQLGLLGETFVARAEGGR